MTTLTDAAKIRYRAAFDTHVSNFGSYNILIGIGVGSNEDRDFIIGYRPEPREIILCPVEPGTAQLLSDPITLFESDILSYLADAEKCTVGIITIKGDRYEMAALPQIPVTGLEPQTLMDQSPDALDFLGFSGDMARILAPAP